jgi:hypothetical protein
MDNILYAITSKKIGYDAEYDFLLETIWQYLINPMAYYAVQPLPFKDLLLKEYSMHLIYKLNEDLGKRKMNKSEVIISRFLKSHKKQIKEEQYLKATFVEDFQHSCGELVQIFNQLHAKGGTVSILVRGFSINAVTVSSRS